jgi:hypothetical protein
MWAILADVLCRFVVKCRIVIGLLNFTAIVAMLVASGLAAEGQTPGKAENPTREEPAPRAAEQAELEAAFKKMLSGATLEGSFTNTGAGRDPTRLSREKYTLGNITKVAGNLWLIPARIEYGEHDVTLPITVPIRWAGDTPVIVVDNIPLPGFGTVSARVMFFADHYAGYWKHGESGGHLFGTIRRGDEPATEPDAANTGSPSSIGDSLGGQQPEK